MFAKAGQSFAISCRLCADQSSACSENAAQGISASAAALSFAQNAVALSNRLAPACAMWFPVSMMDAKGNTMVALVSAANKFSIRALSHLSLTGPQVDFPATSIRQQRTEVSRIRTFLPID